MKVCTVSTNGHTLFYKMQKASFSVNVLCVLVYLTLLVRRHQTVHLVGFREVQLGPVWNLLKLWTLIEGATHSCLPGSGVVRNPIRQLPSELCPRLCMKVYKKEINEVNVMTKPYNLHISIC